MKNERESHRNVRRRTSDLMNYDSLDLVAAPLFRHDQQRSSDT